jgi:tetratricopeptide (TPR) repeat protein/energy-coupling factor transporter ATP-binding protein EcfA2
MAAGVGVGRPFVGRLGTVETLRRQFEDARGGAGGFTLLVGDTGVGKSTLVTELVHHMRTRGTRVLLGQAAASDDPAPFSLVNSALDSAREGAGSGAGDAGPLGGGPVMIGFAPGFADSSFPPPTDFDDRLLDALGGLSPQGGVSRERVLSEKAAEFVELARHGPTALILEDVQRADESSLAVLEALAEQLPGHALWVLATSRRSDSLNESQRTRVEKLEASARPRRVVLDPLTSQEVAMYLHVVDPSRQFTPEEIARRHSETGGNPLLLDQLDRRAALSSGVSDGIGRAPVDETSRRVLEAAAVLGSSFPFGTLLAASGVEEERLAESVDTLVDHGLLFERPGELLEFPDDRLREEAYLQLSDERRRALHRQVGGALEATGGRDPSAVFTLARHFYVGQEYRKSLEYNRLAAQAAERALAPDVASDFLLRALESQRRLDPEDRDGEAALVVEMGRLTYDLGLLEQAEAFLRGYLGLRGDDPRLGPRFRAATELILARVLTSRGDSPGAVRLAERILSSPGVEGDRLLRIGALRQLAMSRYYEGRYTESLTYNAEELQLARELGNERLIALALIFQVGNLAMIGEPDRAVEGAREVARIFDRLGTAGDSAQGHLFLGNMLADNKSNPAYRAEALVELERTIRLAEQANDLRRVGWALYHSAEVLRVEGRLEAADRSAQRAFDTLGQVGDLAGQGVAMKVRGQVATARADYRRAERDLLEAHRLLQGLQHTLEETEVLLRLAELSAARGDFAGAGARVSELTRMNLPKTRPDLLAEFDELQRTLAAKWTGGT